MLSSINKESLLLKSWFSMDSTSTHLFQSTAEYYSRFRPGYSDAFISHMIELCVLSPKVAYDLGCGTGELSLPLSRHVDKVYAVDSELAMINQAQKKASANGYDNITFIVSKAEELPTDIPNPQLVTMGNCFHWMDRAKVLDHLANRMSLNAIVAIISESPLGLVQQEDRQQPKPKWMGELFQFLDDWFGQSTWMKSIEGKTHTENCSKSLVVGRLKTSSIQKHIREL